MNIMDFGSGFAIVMLLHALAVIAFFTGLLFFIILAMKKFTEKELKMWALWLIIGGILVSLLTAGAKHGFKADYSKYRLMDDAKMGMMKGDAYRPTMMMKKTEKSASVQSKASAR